VSARALIAVGSNIDPELNLPAGVAALLQHPEVDVLAVSPVYESEPVGRPGDPKFHNAALRVETPLCPAALRTLLHSIEAEHGRVRTGDPDAPRTLDLDLVLYEGMDGETRGMRYADPEIAVRTHLAVPLADVAPDWVLPEGGGTLAETAAALDVGELRRLHVNLGQRRHCGN
jgi:2-amino-4-hydroxy-6-hydroxymethyldihydropteridine diphosphokinase